MQSMLIWAAQAGDFFPGLLSVVLLILSFLLIVIVLIQRGKGGGLAGAFGGVGGSSAFGSKAGDTFTRLTMIFAGIWVFIIMLLDKILESPIPQ